MWTIAAAGLLSLAAVDVEVQPLSGDAWSGQLVAISDTTVTVGTPDGPKKLEFAELISVTPKRKTQASDTAPTCWIRLLDGSQLKVTSYTVKDRKALVKFPSGGTLELPTRAIHSVRLKPLNDTLREQWTEILEAKSSGDLIAIQATAESLDSRDGILQDVTEDKVHFKLDDDVIPANRAKLFGLKYHSVGRSLPKSVCRIVDINGNVWNSRAVTLDGDALQLTSSTNVRHKLGLDQIEVLDFSAGNIVYLSDVDPESVRWTPFHGLKLPSEGKLYAPQRNRGLLFDGEKLMLGDRAYDKGLAIHSRTEMTFRLTDEFKHFHTLAGIDDRVGDDGDIELIIFGDKRELFRKSLTGADEPLPIHLNIEGVKRLRILVDYGKKSVFADHLNLCQVRISK